MANVRVENTREHDITVNLAADGAINSVTIPAARQDPNDRNKLINGFAEVDESHITEARKAHPAVAHYFNAGWLRSLKGKEAAAAAAAAAEEQAKS